MNDKTKNCSLDRKLENKQKEEICNLKVNARNFDLRIEKRKTEEIIG
jgi:hypothetical protein